MDMKKYSASIEAMRMAQAAARNGGATTITGLELARSRVAKCESDLAAAREQMRGAAKAAGVKLGGLFAESLFVSRARAEEWCDTARDEGRAETIAAYARILAPPTPEEMALGAAVRRAIAAGGFKSVLGGDDAASLDSSNAAADLARRILAAGERARSTGENERPEPTGLPRAIVNSGRKRRGLKELD
jgi:hypothetical protein